MEKLKRLTEALHYANCIDITVRSNEYKDGVGKCISDAKLLLTKRFRNKDLNHGETAAGIAAIEMIESKISTAVNELPKIREQLNKLEERNAK
ncbi:MAG: hypothetical protein U9N61_11090 [Euryarchaeota archaeon]|nr:hypothetical protein [Euryarchaeota archaeon]